MTPPGPDDLSSVLQPAQILSISEETVPTIGTAAKDENVGESSDGLQHYGWTSTLSTTSSTQLSMANEGQESDERPPFSYTQLIVQAIMSTADKQQTLNGIYQYILENYPYFKTIQKKRWSNSIRHTLSFWPHFEKARTQVYSGRGLWKIHASCEQGLVERAFVKNPRGIRKIPQRQKKRTVDPPMGIEVDPPMGIEVDPPGEIEVDPPGEIPLVDHKLREAVKKQLRRSVFKKQNLRESLVVPERFWIGANRYFVESATNSENRTSAIIPSMVTSTSDYLNSNPGPSSQLDVSHDKMYTMTEEEVLKSSMRETHNRKSLQLMKMCNRVPGPSSEASTPRIIASVERHDGGEKPPYPYSQLITQAITSAPDKKLTLKGIYRYIVKKYPYFKHKHHWKNTLRSTLSQNFSRCSPQKEGGFWTIDPSRKRKSTELAFRRRKSHIRSSNSNTSSSLSASMKSRICSNGEEREYYLKATMSWEYADMFRDINYWHESLHGPDVDGVCAPKCEPSIGLVNRSNNDLNESTDSSGSQMMETNSNDCSGPLMPKTYSSDREVESGNDDNQEFLLSTFVPCSWEEEGITPAKDSSNMDQINNNQDTSGCGDSFLGTPNNEVKAEDEVKSYTGIPHVCTLCHHAFAHTAGLRSHMLQFHTTQRIETELTEPYGKTGKTTYSEKQENGDDKLYLCDHCRKLFTLKSSLITHMQEYVLNRHVTLFGLDKIETSMCKQKELVTYAGIFACSICNKAMHVKEGMDHMYRGQCKNSVPQS